MCKSFPNVISTSLIIDETKSFPDFSKPILLKSESSFLINNSLIVELIYLTKHNKFIANYYVIIIYIF